MIEGSAVPTVEELQEYLKRRKPLGWEWDGASVRPLNVKPDANHWTFCANAHGVTMVLRLVNPVGIAGKSGWLTLQQEYRLLRRIDAAGARIGMIAPRAFGLDRRGFRLPVLIQEFIYGEPLSKLKNEGRLTVEHVVKVAELIASLSRCEVPRWRFPALWHRTERSYRPHIAKAHDRLDRILAPGQLRGQADLGEWVGKLRELTGKVAGVLGRFEPMLAASPSVFIFKGAHLGNVLWQEATEWCRFVDLEHVAWGDPVFTLARLLSSVPANRDRWLDPKYVQAASLAYQHHYSMLPVPDFDELVQARLLERELADAVWVVWEHVERGRTQSVEEATNVRVRCDRVRELILIAKYGKLA
ncbi:aminoglycoside phosphotransferase family protein [Candidatus Parcubacteria bacterium]|nr:aminoglycoside phosphotransferase family protein [Candidatus Parcubacteria bacterium]